MPEFTDEQIVEGIRAALRAADVEAVGGLLTLLALQNPRRAEEVRKLMLAGIKIAREVAG